MSADERVFQQYARDMYRLLGEIRSQLTRESDSEWSRELKHKIDALLERMEKEFHKQLWGF